MTLRRNILALSKSANTITGEHSSMTLTASAKEAETWDGIRKIVDRL